MTIISNSKVRIITITPEAEQVMAYCARVSSPQNQDSQDYTRLLAYCLRKGHWSVFEMAEMTVEISTSRAIAQQLLRHRSFTFQEHSQRYAEAQQCYVYKARRQDEKNRQNSIDDMSDEDQEWFLTAQADVIYKATDLYNQALARGIAKEQARFLLPLSTGTRMYMRGSIRSWIHYLQARLDPSTQMEHREIAEKIRTIFCYHFPTVRDALMHNASLPESTIEVEMEPEDITGNLFE